MGVVADSMSLHCTRVQHALCGRSEAVSRAAAAMVVAVVMIVEVVAVGE
jgi:hypothetical protein